MDRAAWIELNVRGLADWFAAIGKASPSARLIEREGVVAVVAPRTPGRSVFNSVAYTDPEALAAAREEIAAEYARGGCAWTVWVPEDDTGTAVLLENAGHRLDAKPRAMGMELAGFEQPDMAGIDWTGEADFEEAMLVNDRAYGYREGTFMAGIGARPDATCAYLAWVDGRPAAAVVSFDHRDGGGADCSIWCVATIEAQRGKGLAAALMRQSLWEARQRGCATSTLQSTKLGRPVYERIGYRDFGALQMWEHRPPELAAEAHPAPPA